MSLTRSRRFGFFLILAGAIFLGLSVPRVFRSPGSMMDFADVYFSTRCLLRHCDPYNPHDVLRLYEEEGGTRSSDSNWGNPYFPTAFAVTLPFAVFTFSVAKALWIAVTVVSLTVAAFLMWNLGAEHAPEFAGGLLSLILAYSVQVMLYGNPGGIAVSLSVVALWCFLRERFVPAGVFCLSVSLALKSHDSGLLWLFLLLAGGTYRRRALETVAVTAAISLPTTLWVIHASPNWASEIRSVWQTVSAHGAMYDPGSAASAINLHGTCLIANLQSLFGVLRDDPHFYNLATLVVFVPLFVTWSIVTLRARFNANLALLAVASIAPLSMLPIYHRIYDAKIIMLTVPACALLWAEGGRIGRLAMIITVAGCVLTGDLVWSLYFEFLMHLHLLPAVSPSPLMAASINVPLPLILLIMAVFYLSVYIHRAFHPASFEKTAQLEVAATPHS